MENWRTDVLLPVASIHCIRRLHFANSIYLCILQAGEKSYSNKINLLICMTVWLCVIFLYISVPNKVGNTSTIKKKGPGVCDMYDVG